MLLLDASPQSRKPQPSNTNKLGKCAVVLLVLLLVLPCFLLLFLLLPNPHPSINRRKTCKNQKVLLLGNTDGDLPSHLPFTSPSSCFCLLLALTPVLKIHRPTDLTRINISRHMLRAIRRQAEISRMVARFRVAGKSDLDTIFEDRVVASLLLGRGRRRGGSRRGRESGSGSASANALGGGVGCRTEREVELV